MGFIKDALSAIVGSGGQKPFTMPLAPPPPPPPPQLPPNPPQVADASVKGAGAAARAAAAAAAGGGMGDTIRSSPQGVTGATATAGKRLLGGEA